MIAPKNSLSAKILFISRHKINEIIYLKFTFNLNQIEWVKTAIVLYQCIQFNIEFHFLANLFAFRSEIIEVIYWNISYEILM